MKPLSKKHARNPLSYLILAGLILLLNCRGNDNNDTNVDPFFNRSGRYRASLYGSEAECRRINPNPEIGCYSWVAFSPDGRADASIGGSDIIMRGDYLQQNDTVVLRLSFTTIVFTVLNSGTLVDDKKMVWRAY